MSAPLVKICGITRSEDALVAVSLGAMAIGFVFWPKSPRFIDPYRARHIAAQLPAFVTPVGVFVNQPIAYVNAVATLVGLAAIQLHGDEAPEYGARMARSVIRALSGDGVVVEADRWHPGVVLLVDAYDKQQRGGTGRTADWTAAAALARHRRVMLAGGLHAGNVTDAIGAVKPFGIDVSSGVEWKPGIKDHEKLAALFARVKRQDDNGVR